MVCNKNDSDVGVGEEIIESGVDLYFLLICVLLY